MSISIDVGAASVEGEHVARLWFVGANPWLDEISPIEAIKDMRVRTSSPPRQPSLKTGSRVDGCVPGPGYCIAKSSYGPLNPLPRSSGTD